MYIEVCLLCNHACVCSVRVSDRVWLGKGMYLSRVIRGKMLLQSSIQLLEKIAHHINFTKHTLEISTFLSYIPSLIQREYAHEMLAHCS